MKNKKDDRADETQDIKRTINNTVQNMQIANEKIEEITDGKNKKILAEENDRRKDDIEALKEKVRDEYEEDQ